MANRFRELVLISHALSSRASDTLAMDTHSPDRAVFRGPRSYRSMISIVILVRRARSWNTVGDLRSIGMSPG